MATITDNLKKAGLDSEECPMLNCYGHLNFVEAQSFFMCSLCNETFYTEERLKLWKEQNKDIKLWIKNHVQQEREDSEADRYGFVAEGL
jgi:hypothetical protein